jgi:CubicO group peptidase (beta-lactamase class C family)
MKLSRPLILFLAIFSSAIAAPIARSQDTNTARMEEIIQSYVTTKQFMGTVLVARDQNVILDKAYGFANLEWSIPNTPTTKFRLGSITKQFTATSILLLQERGKLKIDDPVKKYMPDAPAAWDKITIYNLLTHTSGIPSFTGFPDYHSTEATPTTPEQLVARFRDKPLEFQPGEKWNYSNSGYVLLGYLIEKISGETYEKFVQENIFTPLGMKNSGYDSNSEIIVHRAYGYSPGKESVENAGYIDMTIPFSAGALYSTTEDLLRWEQGLFGGKILSAASLQKMTTPFLNDYGCGVAVHDEKGHKLVDHGGGIEGFNTQLSYYPDEKLAIIALSNLNGAAPGAIATNLAATIHGEKVVLSTERKEIKLPTKTLAQYVGDYQLSPNFALNIRLEGDQLISKATGQGDLKIYPESETLFFPKEVDAEIEFVKNDKGEVTHLILHQNGHDTKGVKK